MSTQPPLPPDKYPQSDPQPFYDLVTYRLTTQQGTITALDEKVAQLFLLSTALLAILAGVFAIDRSFDWVQIVLALVALGAYVYVLDRSLSAYRPRKWFVGPSIRQVWRQMGREHDDALIRWSIAVGLWATYRKNVPLIEEKERALKEMFRGVLIQTALVLFALVLVAVEA